MPRQLSYFLILLGFVLVVWVLGRYVIRDYTAKLAGKLVVELARQQASESYQFEFAESKFDPFQNTLYLKEFSILPTPSLAEKPIEKYEVFIPLLELEIGSLWNLYLNDILEVVNVSLLSPQIKVYINRKNTNPTFETSQLYQKIEKYVDNLSIQKLDLTHLQLELHDLKTQETFLRIDDLDFLLDQFAYTADQENKTFDVSSTFSYLVVRNQSFRDKNGQYNAQFDSLIYNSKDKTLRIYSVQLDPTFQGHLIQIPYVLLQGYDLTKMNRQGLVRFDQLIIEKPSLILDTLKIGSPQKKGNDLTLFVLDYEVQLNDLIIHKANINLPAVIADQVFEMQLEGLSINLGKIYIDSIVTLDDLMKNAEGLLASAERIGIQQQQKPVVQFLDVSLSGMGKRFLSRNWNIDFLTERIKIKGSGPLMIFDELALHNLLDNSHNHAITLTLPNSKIEIELSKKDSASLTKKDHLVRWIDPFHKVRFIDSSIKIKRSDEIISADWQSGDILLDSILLLENQELYSHLLTTTTFALKNIAVQSKGFEVKIGSLKKGKNLELRELVSPYGTVESVKFQKLLLLKDHNEIRLDWDSAWIKGIYWDEIKLGTPKDNGLIDKLSFRFLGLNKIHGKLIRTEDTLFIKNGNIELEKLSDSQPLIGFLQVDELQANQEGSYFLVKEITYNPDSLHGQTGSFSAKFKNKNINLTLVADSISFLTETPKLSAAENIVAIEVFTPVLKGEIGKLEQKNSIKQKWPALKLNSGEINIAVNQNETEFKLSSSNYTAGFNQNDTTSLSEYFSTIQGHFQNLHLVQMPNDFFVENLQITSDRIMSENIVLSYPELFKGTIERVIMDKSGWSFRNEEVQIPKIKIVSPTFETLEFPSRKPPHRFSTVSIKQLEIENGNMQVAFHGNKPVKIEEINAKIQEGKMIRTDTTSLFYSPSSFLHTGAVDWPLDKYELLLENVRYQADENIIQVVGTYFANKEEKYTFSSRLTSQEIWSQIFIEELSMQNLDLHRLLNHQEIIIPNLKGIGLKLNYYKDRTHPLPPAKEKALPVLYLSELKWPLSIDTVNFIIDTIRYSERNPGFELPAEIYFANLKGAFNNITNLKTKIIQNPYLSLDLSGQLYSSGKLKIEGLYSLDDPSGYFLMNGNVSNFHLPELNRLLMHAAPVSIISGNSRSLSFSFSADTALALGSMEFLYTNLKVKFLNRDVDVDERSARAGFKSFFANTFVVNKNNPRFVVPREGDIYFERNKEKSIFNYWAKAILSGTVSSIGARGHKKELRKLRKVQKKEN